jgi:hypothetical protein
LKVVNIGGGLVVPAECIVRAIKLLAEHFENGNVEFRNRTKRSRTDFDENRKTKDEIVRSLSASGRIREERRSDDTRTQKTDKFHTAIDILVRGTYPGSMVHAILDWDNYARGAYQLSYNRFRRQQIMSK